MACPFFVPVEPLGRDHWLQAPRFPLGEAYRGVCRAGSEPFTPPESSLEELCNCGYARGRCDRFPNDAVDAVRFSIINEDEATIRVIYILERNHWPEKHGVIDYSKLTGRVEVMDERLSAQARAFIGTHLRNASGASSQLAADSESSLPHKSTPGSGS